MIVITSWSAAVKYKFIYSLLSLELTISDIGKLGGIDGIRTRCKHTDLTMSTYEQET